KPKSQSDYSVDKLADDVANLAKHLGRDKFHLVGHDWGGAVVWGVSSAMPQVLKSSSVLSTPHPDAIKTTAKYWWSPQSLMLSYLKLVRIPDLEKAMFIAGPEGFALGLAVMGLPYSKARTYAQTIGNTAGMRAALSWYHANEVPASYLIGKSTVPTLYMWGDKDFAFSRDAANKTAEFVDAPYRFVPLENVGHWVPERATDRVVSEVLAHIEANS
ncbi:MAG: alpha/beta fold hydrolase, partial [Solirubrobacterales bacterium]